MRPPLVTGPYLFLRTWMMPTVELDQSFSGKPFFSSNPILPPCIALRALLRTRCERIRVSPILGCCVSPIQR